MEWRFKEYRLTDNRSEVDIDVVHHLVSTSYWAMGRSKSVVEKTVENSLCFSLFLNEDQIGFARVVTDYAVFAWIADVVIHPNHRGKGLGKFLIEVIDQHPDVPDDLKLLRTKDAHTLYERFGFERGEYLNKEQA